MKKYSRLLILVLSAAVFVSCARTTETYEGFTGEDSVNFSGCTEGMYSADYWIKKVKNRDRLIMTKEEIQDYNGSLIASSAISDVNMDEYPPVLDRQVLTKLLNIYSIPAERRYIDNDIATESYYNTLISARNMDAVQEQTVVGYGIVVNETNLRDFPTDDVSYREPENAEFDMFQESRLKVWERVAILHESFDKKWVYIQGRSYIGWIKVQDVALTDRQTWLSYKDRDFIVVTGNRILLDYNPYDESLSRKEMLMGTSLPLTQADAVDGVSAQSSYTVLVPGRDDKGCFVEKTARIPRHWDVSLGYLPYTKKNVINQAFKVLGERYGWGGSYNARDCSAYIRDVYMTFGFLLPRNSANQASVTSPGHLDVSSMDDGEKEAAIMRQQPGTIIEMKGHVMMYLGSAGGKAYVIHDVYAYGESGLKGANGRRTVNCVNISDLYVTRADGSTFLENVRNVTPVGIQK